jgi:hypothetical protein
MRESLNEKKGRDENSSFAAPSPRILWASWMRLSFSRAFSWCAKQPISHRICAASEPFPLPSLFFRKPEAALQKKKKSFPLLKDLLSDYQTCECALRERRQQITKYAQLSFLLLV